ncbi:ATP-dependent DNA helicase srs2 [Podospora conica]|nr:ATP-dependent DNA helicase srs2 [Schizothecium conicum]
MPPSSRPPSILDKLNDAQRRAVSSEAATVAILAGPGSGKTHTLTSRVVWLIDHIGYRPQDVIVATFTVKAAKEMKERIGRALGGGRENKIVLGTFHSISRRYLAAYGRQIGLAQKFGIADDNDSRNIVSRICKRLQLAIDPPVARSWISKRKSGGTEMDARKKAALAKTPGLQELQTCYDEYQKHLERSNLLDYDDLLVRCVELLKKSPSCVDNIQTVLIDEYQDTNGIQYELMKLFAQRHRRITIVGDPDQSIYGWRSAEIRNLYRLLREFPETEEVSLEENYRSSQSILGLSLQVIQQDKARYKKVLKPVHSKGSRPVLRRLKSAPAEGEWIVSEIRRVALMSGDMLNNSDIAILLRSAALSRHVESALGKAGVAYKMVGGFKFYDRTEIKVLLDYLRVIHQPENNDALARIMNVPRRGIGEGTIKNLVEEAEQASMSLWSLLVKHCRGDRTAKTKLQKHAEQKISGGLIRLVEVMRKRAIDAAADPTSTPFSLVDLIEHLLKALDLQKVLKDAHPDDHEQRWANVQEFINLAGDFARDQSKAAEEEALPQIEGLEQTPDSEILPKFLANVSLASDAQKGGDDGESKPMVTISTIHAAKGLEWPIVFIPAVYNGSIPHMRSEDSDEERRLLYVAMTRAKSLLYLSCPLYSSNGNGERNQLSPFVEPVSGHFAKKGPCLDRPVMEQIAQILERQLPSNDVIYKGLPQMYCPEDNLFPVDPEERQQDPSSRYADSRGGGAPGADAQRPKRPRLSGPGNVAADDKEAPWSKGYSTTMEESSTFTVSSLPGFVSVGKHQAAITAAAAATEAAAKAEKERSLKRSASNPTTTTKRPSNQKSIMGFINKPGTLSNPPTDVTPIQSGSMRPAARPPSTFNQFGLQRAHSNPVKPAIEPELAAHKLGSAAKLMPRPVHRPPSPVAANSKRYTCFSSSPPRPEKAETIKAEEEDDGPPPEPSRPAACLHSTTVNMPKGVAGVFKRPAGLRREGIAPVAQLRKPFKPLTINRSL